MRFVQRFTLRPALAAAVALFAAACADSPSSPLGVRVADGGIATTMTTETTVGSGVLDDPTQWYRRIWVCKVGTNANFSVSVNGAAPTLHALLDGQCKMVHYMDSADPNQIDTVKVTELYDANTVLDSIVVDSTHNLLKFRLPTITGTDEVRTYTFRSKGAIATFYNHVKPPPPPPPEEGGQGCTPGYWKQPHHFDSWTLPYYPGMRFSDAFNSNAFGSMTLLQVLGQGGGGINALGRHAVAALLNSASVGVSFDYTPTGVINAFNAAVNGGDIEGQKNIFAGFNEQGCPIS